MAADFPERGVGGPLTGRKASCGQEQLPGHHALASLILETKATGVSLWRCGLPWAASLSVTPLTPQLACLSPGGTAHTQARIKWPPWPALHWTMQGQRWLSPSPVLGQSGQGGQCSWARAVAQLLKALGPRGGRRDAKGGQHLCWLTACLACGTQLDPGGDLDPLSWVLAAFPGTWSKGSWGGTHRMGPGRGPERAC